MWVRKKNGEWHQVFRITDGLRALKLVPIMCASKNSNKGFRYDEESETRPTSNLCKKCLKKEGK